jgi:Ca-activated chloride channel family protein
LKPFYLIFFFGLLYNNLPAQYYFTGEVKDPHGDKLQNGSILVQSTGTVYGTGTYGDFEIVSRRAEDSLILSFDGYETLITAVKANEYLRVILKKPSLPGHSQKSPVKCIYTGVREENSFVDRGGPVSFAGNIHRASYGIVEKFLGMGYPVPSEAVQIEELLNHFSLSHEEPENNEPLDCSSTMLTCPWNAAHTLLALNICARKMDLQNVPPANLVLLIDASGSMDLPNKLPLIKSGIRLLTDNLRDQDNVSIIAFGGKVRRLMEGVPGSKKERILRAIEDLAADGITPGEEGVRLAYEVARRHLIEGGNNRIVLITDGDVGQDPFREQELEDFVAGQSQDGISLHVIGVGMDEDGNSRLPLLAEKGNGHFAYAADEEDAARLLAGQLTPASLAIADGVSVRTDFDTALVNGYRLIGYDNKKCRTEDTAFRLAGGRICSGHSLMAIFELIPRVDTTGRDTVATIQVDYCLPGKKLVKSLSFYCAQKIIPFDRAENSLRRAVCIAMLGMKLRDNANATAISWTDIERMTKKNFPGNGYMDREFMDLVGKAKKIYGVGN